MLILHSLCTLKVFESNHKNVNQFLIQLLTNVLGRFWRCTTWGSTALGGQQSFPPKPTMGWGQSSWRSRSQLSCTQDIWDDSLLYLLSSMVLQSSGKGTPLTFLTLRSTEHPSHPAAAVPLSEHVHLQNWRGTRAVMDMDTHLFNACTWPLRLAVLANSTGIAPYWSIISNETLVSQSKCSEKNTQFFQESKLLTVFYYYAQYPFSSMFNRKISNFFFKATLKISQIAFLFVYRATKHFIAIASINFTISIIHE